MGGFNDKGWPERAMAQWRERQERALDVLLRSETEDAKLATGRSKAHGPRVTGWECPNIPDAWRKA